jgi:Uma2 family endonuclease
LIVLSRAHAAVLAKQGVRAKDAAMSMLAQRRVTVDEFLVWAEGQEGRWELHNGVPYRMPPERTGHVEVKYAAYMALMQAIRMAGVPCHVLGDGVGVRVSQYVMYVPDALVYCGPKLPRDALEVPNPVIHPGRGGVTIDAQV